LSMEQRLAIKFCFKAGKSATETLQMVNAAYGDQVLPRSNVFRWYGRFRDGREDTEDDHRSGRPTECRNDNNVEKISQLLLQHRHLSLRMLADEVNIGNDTVRKTVVEDLRKRKICSRFVPHSLTPEHKDRRNTACRDLIATADSDPDFFKKIVTGDETWCFVYDPTTTRQSAAWAGETSPRPKKLRLQKSRVKTMLVIFFDWQGVIHKEFVPEGEIISAEYYKGVMERSIFWDVKISVVVRKKYIETCVMLYDYRERELFESVQFLFVRLDEKRSVQKKGGYRRQIDRWHLGCCCPHK